MKDCYKTHTSVLNSIGNINIFIYFFIIFQVSFFSNYTEGKEYLENLRLEQNFREKRYFPILSVFNKRNGVKGVKARPLNLFW